tara:strand:- start:461 stop:802 length:342 start_codon:yes stop_codon:yes gene_type:complete
MIFCFDIDNTICKTKGKNYKNAKPHKDIIKIINKLYNNGHTIKIFTARYMGRNNDNIKLAYKEGYNNTLKQLKKWNLKFHKLLMGKPSFDILIDDRALGFKRNDIQKLKKFLK